MYCRPGRAGCPAGPGHAAARVRRAPRRRGVVPGGGGGLSGSGGGGGPGDGEGVGMDRAGGGSGPGRGGGGGRVWRRWAEGWGLGAFRAPGGGGGVVGCRPPAESLLPRRRGPTKLWPVLD